MDNGLQNTVDNNTLLHVRYAIAPPSLEHYRPVNEPAQVVALIHIGIIEHPY